MTPNLERHSKSRVQRKAQLATKPTKYLEKLQFNLYPLSYTAKYACSEENAY
jgi:hypothetical protein